VAAGAGILIGLFAAWWGSLWDGILMRVMDVLLAFPAILLALLIIAIVGPGTPTSIAAIAIVYTPIFARVVRGPALSLKQRDFVDAARTFGSSQGYILSRHLLLNLVAPLTVQVTLALAWALLTEAGLSFLGLGSQPPSPSLGLMLADSRNLMQHAPWLMIFPGLAIMLGILGFNLTGDALRDILDPRTQRRSA
jgi:peptide/nickel transport system permease protein